MKLKSFLKLICYLFTAKVIFGVIYLLLGWQATIAGWAVPSWLVIIAILTDSCLAYLACKLAK